MSLNGIESFTNELVARNYNGEAVSKTYPKVIWNNYLNSGGTGDGVTEIEHGTSLTWEMYNGYPDGDIEDYGYYNDPGNYSGILFNTALVITELAVQAYEKSTHLGMGDFNLKASNDGTNWTTLGSWYDQTWEYGEKKFFTVANTISYTHYIVTMTKFTEGTSVGGVKEIKFGYYDNLTSFSHLENINAKFALANISNSTEIDILNTDYPLQDGDSIIIKKNDNSIVEYNNINGVSGSGPYSYTLNPTMGEVPIKAFVSNSELSIDDGTGYQYLEKNNDNTYGVRTKDIYYMYEGGIRISFSDEGKTVTKANYTTWLGGNAYGFIVVSGDKYIEVTGLHTEMKIGICTDNTYQADFIGTTNYGWSYASDGTKVTNDVLEAYGDSYIETDVIGIRYNHTTGELSFYKNGVNQGVAYTLPAGTDIYFGSSMYESADSIYFTFDNTQYLPSGATELSAIELLTLNREYNNIFIENIYFLTKIKLKNMEDVCTEISSDIWKLL